MSQQTILKLLINTGLMTEEQSQGIALEYQKSQKTFTDILFQEVSVQSFKDLFLYEINFTGTRKTPARPGKSREMTDKEIDLFLGQLLIQLGLMTEETFKEALAKRSDTSTKIGEYLIHENYLTREVASEAFKRILQVPFIDLETYDIEYSAVRLLPQKFILEHNVLPIKRESKELLLAVLNPLLSQDVIQKVQDITGCNVQIAIVEEPDLMEAINDIFYPDKDALPPVDSSELAARIDESDIRIDDTDKSKTGDISDSITPPTENISTVQLVNSIIKQALESRTTDIHLEPQKDKVRVRYRVDGLLFDVMTVNKDQESSILARLKVLANMDITERRRPQDGHFSFSLNERSFDIRVATLPTQFGEKMVMRLLDETRMLTGSSQLGFEPDDLVIVREMCRKPYGMILVTGPIGSGKTTTLYAALSEINTSTNNIVTIEDPIEYHLPGINQVNVDLKSDITFATGLRAILRQDVDVMMVGEIRDTETAAIAVRAAMTGHLLFSTLHTNDAPGALTTLQHLGIKPFLIAGSLIGVIAQRLVRIICPNCKETYSPSPAERTELGLSSKQRVNLYRGKGCDLCFNSGYFGRTGVFEVMPIDEDLRKLILNNASETVIREAAVQSGMHVLKTCGIQKVLQGITTFEEFIRVIYI